MSLGLMAALSACVGAVPALFLSRAGYGRLVAILAALSLALAVGLIVTGHFVAGMAGLGYVAVASVFVIPFLIGLAIGALAARILRR
jgi:hypothetical protein